jgi:hypothetical protein
MKDVERSLSPYIDRVEIVLKPFVYENLSSY